MFYKCHSFKLLSTSRGLEAFYDRTIEFYAEKHKTRKKLKSRYKKRRKGGKGYKVSWLKKAAWTDQNI